MFALQFSVEPFHLEAAEFDRIIVAGEADETVAAIEATRDVFHLATVKLVDIEVKDSRAVEDDPDVLATNFDFLKIPLASRSKVALLGSSTKIEAAMVLVVFQAWLAGLGQSGVVALVVDNLKFKAVVGTVPSFGNSNGDAIVAGLRQPEFGSDATVAK